LRTTLFWFLELVLNVLSYRLTPAVILPNYITFVKITYS